MVDVKQTLKSKKFLPSKKMGQNFLSDINVINKICDSIPELDQYDCVIEIGPGLGAITTHLATKTDNLICIELDKRLYADLKNKFNKHSNVKLINDDFLEVDLDQLCKEYKKIIVVANIPYSITTPIILKCLSFNKIKCLYIMVQKEVADKWVYSKPSNRNASTNVINYYFDISKKMIIKNTCFVPAPKVDSAMVLLTRKNDEAYDAQFYSFIRPFFLAKRKKLTNNIPANINKDLLVQCLNNLGFDNNVRAEQLTYNDWFYIYKIFNK